MAYCGTDDLARFGTSAVALSPIDPEIQSDACDTASAVVDSYLRDRYQLPLSAWGVDIRRATAVLATYDLLVVRGFAPSAGSDVNFRLRYDDTLKWLQSVARQELQPDVTPQQHQSPGFDAPRILTNATRGWPQSGKVMT